MPFSTAAQIVKHRDAMTKIFERYECKHPAIVKQSLYEPIPNELKRTIGGTLCFLTDKSLHHDPKKYRAMYRELANLLDVGNESTFHAECVQLAFYSRERIKIDLGKKIPFDECYSWDPFMSELPLNEIKPDVPLDKQLNQRVYELLTKYKSQTLLTPIAALMIASGDLLPPEIIVCILDFNENLKRMSKNDKYAVIDNCMNGIRKVLSKRVIPSTAAATQKSEKSNNLNCVLFPPSDANFSLGQLQSTALVKLVNFNKRKRSNDVERDTARHKCSRTTVLSKLENHHDQKFSTGQISFN